MAAAATIHWRTSLSYLLRRPRQGPEPQCGRARLHPTVALEQVLARGTDGERFRRFISQQNDSRAREGPAKAAPSEPRSPRLVAPAGIATIRFGCQVVACEGLSALFAACRLGSRIAAAAASLRSLEIPAVCMRQATVGQKTVPDQR